MKNLQNKGGDIMNSYDALESMGIYPERIQAQADKIFNMVEEVTELCEEIEIEVTFGVADIYDSVQEYFQNNLNMKEAGSVSMTNQMIAAWFSAGERFINEVREAGGIDMKAEYYPDVNEFVIYSGNNKVYYQQKGDFSDVFTEDFIKSIGKRTFVERE